MTDRDTTMNIAILDDYQQVALRLADWDSLPASVRLSVFERHLGPEAAVAETLAPFTVICAMRERTQFPRSLLEKLPKLQLLVTSGLRNAAINLEAARELGITVCGTHSPGHATAELTWGLILALARHIPQEDRAMRQGRWQTTIGKSLRGQTLGVIGLGRLGSQVAGFGRAFGMEVIAWSQNMTEAQAAEHGATWVEKELILADSVGIQIKGQNGA